jgi:hypothetical protein
VFSLNTLLKELAMYSEEKVEDLVGKNHYGRLLLMREHQRRHHYDSPGNHCNKVI